MKGKILSQAVKLDAAHATNRPRLPPECNERSNADAEHEHIDNEDNHGDRGVAAEESERPLLQAAREKRRLVPQLVAAISVDADKAPQAGQSCGRFSPEPPNMPPKICFQRARRICQW